MPHLAHRYEGLGFKGQGSGFIFLVFCGVYSIHAPWLFFIP